MYDCSKHILPSGRHIVSSGMTGFLCLSSPLNTLFPICRVWICYIVMDDVKQTTISLCSQPTLLMIRSSRTDLCSGILSFWQVMTHNFWCPRCKPFPFNSWKKCPVCQTAAGFVYSRLCQAIFFVWWPSKTKRLVQITI